MLNEERHIEGAAERRPSVEEGVHVTPVALSIERLEERINPLVVIAIIGILVGLLLPAVN